MCFVFVSARKSTIAPTQLYQYPPPPPPQFQQHNQVLLQPTSTTTPTTISTTSNNQLKPVYPQNEQALIKLSKVTPHNIDYIVKDAGKNLKKEQDDDKRKNTIVGLKKHNNYNNENVRIDVDSKKNETIEKRKDDVDVVKMNGTTMMVADKQQVHNNSSERFINVYNTFADKSGEVKHARTPLNICSNVTLQTHSPQLPIPSPNYPIQTQSHNIMETAASTCQKNQIHTQPNNNNTFVPIVNNNYINNTPQAASQNDLNKIDYQIVHSIDLKNNVNNNKKESSNEHLTNLSSECKMDDIKQINKVNSTTSNIEQHTTTMTTNCSSIDKSQNACELNVSTIKTEKISETSNHNNNINTNMPIETKYDNCGAFTVLNIPNLQFQQPPNKRQKLSKIDLATLRRKIRRQKRLIKPREKRTLITSPIHLTNTCKSDFGVAVLGFSDSSSSSSSFTSSSDESDCDEQMDLWIKSGPPCKPDYRKNKLDFLGIFKLTTHVKKNCK